MPTPGRRVVQDKIAHPVGRLRQPRCGGREVRLRVNDAAEALPDDGHDDEGKEGSVHRVHRPRPSRLPKAMQSEGKVSAQSVVHHPLTKL